MQKGLSLSILAILIAGCHQNISGSYIADDNNSVAWLQLVRTPDSRLTGQLALTDLKADGTVEQNSTPIAGAVDGENVTLSGTSFLGLQSFTLAGTLDGNTLTLTGVKSIPLIFTRSTPSSYQSQVANLNAKSQSILHAKAVAQAEQRALQEQAQQRTIEQQVQQRRLQQQERFVSGIDALIGKMGRFESLADTHLSRFPGAEKGIEAITNRMEQYISREHQLAGSPNASATRGQLSVAASQAELQTEQAHNQIVALENSMASDVKPIADQATAYDQDCHALSQYTGNLTQEEIQSIRAACDRLTSDLLPFRQKYDAMANGLADLEHVYQRERSRQEELIQELQRLE